MRRLQAGDIEGYLAPLSPEARALEGPLAAAVPRVPLTGISMTVDGTSVEPTIPRLSGVRVDFRYRYQGLPDDNMFRIPIVYELDQVGDRWRIQSGRLSENSTLPIWATGPVQAHRSDHFLALFRPGLPDPLRTLRRAEQARSQLNGKITFPLEKQYLLLMARDRNEYESMTSTKLGQVSAIAQVETSYQVTPENIQVQGRQIIVNVEQLQGDDSALETFRHELGHLAVAQYTRPFTPAWVSESAAMYLAGTRPTSIWRAGLSRREFDRISFADLSRASTLGQHDSTREAISLNYAYAAAAAWYLVETFGGERYWDFYRSFAEVPASALYESLPEGGDPARRDQAIELLAVQTTQRSLRNIFGLDPVQLDARVREWMKTAS